MDEKWGAYRPVSVEAGQLQKTSENIIASVMKLLEDKTKIEYDAISIPEKSVDITHLANQLDEKIKKLEAEKREYHKLLQLAGHKIYTIKDLDIVSSEMATAVTAFHAMVGIDRELKNDRKTFNVCIKKAVTAMLKEEGFDSRQELDTKLNDLWSEKQGLQSEALGFGKLLNKGKINKLQVKIKHLESVRFTPVQQEKYNEGTDYILENNMVEICRASVATMRDKYKSLLGIVQEGVQKEEVILPTSTVESLSDDYISSVLSRELTNQVGKVTENNISDREFQDRWGTKEDRKRVLEIYKLMVQAYEHGGEDERIKVSDKFHSEIDDLPRELRYFINNRGYQKRELGLIWETMQADIQARLPRILLNDKLRLSGQEYVDALVKLRQVVVEDHRDIRIEILGYRIDDLIKDVCHPFSFGSLKSKDAIRWKVFRSNSDIIDMYGQDILDKYEDSVVSEALSTLKANIGMDRVHINRSQNHELVSMLLTLNRKDAVQYLIVNTFRVKDENGKYPFIDSGMSTSYESDLYKYLKSFSSEDLEKLRSTNADVAEIVDLILNNGDTFHEFKLPRPSDDELNDVFGFEPNRVHENIQSKIDDVTVNMILNGSEEDKLFAISRVGQSERPLGKNMKAIQTILDNTDSLGGLYIMRNITDMLSYRFREKGDTEALVVMIQKNLVDFDNADKAWEIISALVHGWDSYPRIRESITKENMDIIAKAMSQAVEVQTHHDKINHRFDAFLVAKYFGLPYKPTAEQVADFYVNSHNLGNTGMGSENIFSLTGNLEFTEGQGRNMVEKVVRERIAIPSVGHGHDAFTNEEGGAIYGLKTGSVLSKKDKDTVLWALQLKNSFDLIQESSEPFKEENWSVVLSHYINSDNGRGTYDDAVRDSLKLILMGSDPQYRDYCLQKMKELWTEYLDSKDGQISIRAKIVTEAVRANDGAGDLKYIDGLAGIMNAIQEKVRLSKRTTKKTIEDLKSGLRSQEERFVKEDWSEDDKTAFYNISKHVIEVAPSLYNDFVELFDVMNSKELREFAKTYFPLYQANLIVLQKEDGKYDVEELVGIRRRLESLKDKIGDKEVKTDEERRVIFEMEEKNIQDSLRENIERRFGLRKIPEKLTQEHLRYMRDFSIYLANVEDRNETKELLIGLYLGLNLNGQWEKFRSGNPVDLSEYFKEDKMKQINDVLADRDVVGAMGFENLGLNEKEAANFRDRLQEETVSQMIGNVQTIDIKLGNAKRNIDELSDPDIYTDATDKEVILLLKEYGKAVGGVLAKTFSVTTGKSVKMSEVETSIQNRLKKTFGVEEWTSTKVKELQDKIQLPNLILNMGRKLDEQEVDQNIQKLGELLNPSAEIIAIFNSFGEEFKQSSGATALSQDLTYLENIVVKNENKITPEQKKMLQDYIESIGSQMKVLETMYGQVKEYFDKIKKSSHVNTNEVLKNRLDEIGKILYQSSDNVAINTRLTCNMTTIIENMRQCLGFLRKEVNNDTNLTFAEPNKFLFVSQGEKERGSIADQLAFFLPVKNENGESEMSFVIDRLYGVKSSDVLTAHVKTVMKKYRSLVKDFPNAKMSIFVTGAALDSAGVTSGWLSTKLGDEKSVDEKNPLKVEYVTNSTVTVPKSVFGDNYIEFGGGARVEGDKKVSGLRVGV